MTRQAGVPTDPDSGFSLLEVLVALAVVTTLMAALTPFLIDSFVVVGQQRSRQVAVQVANDAIEQVRALRGASLLTGRSQAKATTQWNAADSAVQPYLSAMKLVWDPLLTNPASTAGDQAPVPTKEQGVTVGGVTYQRNWYVGRCVQQAGAAYGGCISTDAVDPDPESVDLPFFRVVVAVRWPGSSCTAGSCVYVTSTLVSTGNDAIFNINRPPPLVTNPGSLTAWRTMSMSKQLYASGGLLPVTWTAVGLPPGLSISTSGLVTGVPTTLGTYAVTVTVKDRVLATDSDVFSWTVVNAVVVTNPGNQVSRVGTAVSLAVAGAGGVAPLTWSATNLPAGLSINAATGVVSGTPTSVEADNVTVTATDSKGKAVPVAFTWNVFTPVAMVDPGPRTVMMGGAVAYGLVASGGSTPYTWRADDLPPGLVLNAATGAISGTVTGGTRYLTTFYVADSAGMEVSTVVVHTVSTSVGTDLRVTVPASASPNQVTNAGSVVSLSAAAAGGVGPGYVWSASGLPTGLLIAPSGIGGATITGTPTVKATYTVKLTVRDLTLKTAVLMFTWKVQ